MGKALHTDGSHGTYDSTPIFERIATELYERGYSLVDDAISEQLADTLYERVSTLKQAEFTPAGIGRAQDLMLNSFVRRDEIHWLEPNHPAERGWLEWCEQLRTYLNRRLLLGLFSYEGHFAHYEAGAFYKQHLDAFKGESNRVLTTVLYLNWNWQVEDGGALVLYPESGSDPLATVMPRMAKLAVFLSEEFPHEVLPANRDRYSIAGWFRVNTSTMERVDPPR